MPVFALAIAAALLGADALSASSRAADWPTRPVRIVAPATPGGAADTFARILADNLPDILGGRFFVENRAGAGGLIGAQVTADAEPDGHTFMTSSVAYHAIAPAVSANPGFHPMRDFTHIAYIGGPPNVFVVNPGLGVRSLKELIELARHGPPIGYVSPGVGTLGHLTAERFAQLADIKLQHIPHQGGLAGDDRPDRRDREPRHDDLDLGARPDPRRQGDPDRGHVERAAVGDTRTCRRSRNWDMTISSPRTWFGLSGPAGVPNEIVQKLNRAVVKVLELPDVRKRLERDAIETRAMTSEEFTRFMASEIERWGPLASRSGRRTDECCDRASARAAPRLPPSPEALRARGGGSVG